MNFVVHFLFAFLNKACAQTMQFVPSQECSPEYSHCQQNSDCCGGLLCDLNTCYSPIIPFTTCETVTMAFAGMNPINPNPDQCQEISKGTLTFWKLLRDTGIFPILDQVTWSGTALGPDNQAFTNFVVQYQNTLTFKQIKQAVLYHIIPDIVITPQNATDGMVLRTGLSFSPDADLLCENDFDGKGDLKIKKINNEIQFVAEDSTAIGEFGYHQPCFAKTYILDDVLVPCFPFRCNSIFDMASERLPQFAQLLQQTGLDNQLGERYWKGTVLAPQGEAIAVAQPLLSNLNESQILQIVQYHVIPNVVLKQSQLMQESGDNFFESGACESGEVDCPYVLSFENVNGSVSVEGIWNSVNIISFDVIGCDSVLHYIHGLLLPFEVAQSLSEMIN